MEPINILNNYYAKGPDMLNDMIGIFLRFRMGKIGIVGDIKKMYNSIFLSLLDQFTHLFLWRNMDKSRVPDIYKINRVSFGDRPAGTIAILALRKTAELFGHTYAEAANIIKNDSYVDDIIFSTNQNSKADSLRNEIDFILREGGFEIKEWIMSGQRLYNSELGTYEDHEEKVLGIVWNCTHDIFKFNVKLRFDNSIDSEPITCILELRDKFPKILTRRLISRQIASLFDFLGLLIPFTLKGKILMRELVKEQQSLENISSKDIWDLPITPDMYGKWKEYFSDMFKIPQVLFNRCLEPDSVIGYPSLILFSDGSQDSYGSCAYIRMRLKDGSVFCKLLMAKARIAPLLVVPIPRIELNGCVVSCRLREKFRKI